MFGVALPCDREEPDEVSELRNLVSEYDELDKFDARAMLLSPEQVRELDALYECLLLIEQEKWETGRPASPMAIETIRDATNIDFPMIRYELGLLPGQFR